MRGEGMSRALTPLPCFPVGGARVVRHRAAAPGEFGLRDPEPVRVWWFRSRRDPIWSAVWVPGRAIRVFYDPPGTTAPTWIVAAIKTLRRFPLRYIR
jgi:hypothetical protein